MGLPPVIQEIYITCTRHDRKYVFFSVTGRDEEFLYYSHMFHPLRSLLFGRDFIARLPQLVENEDLCIECGLGLSVQGGVTLDNGDFIEWHCPVKEANRILAGLNERLGDDGHWVVLF